MHIHPVYPSNISIQCLYARTELSAKQSISQQMYKKLGKKNANPDISVWQTNAQENQFTNLWLTDLTAKVPNCSGFKAKFVESVALARQNQKV